MNTVIVNTIENKQKFCKIILHNYLDVDFSIKANSTLQKY